MMTKTINDLPTKQQVIVKTKPRVLYPLNFHILHPELAVVTAISIVGEPAIAVLSIEIIRDNEAAVAYHTKGKKINHIKDYPRELPDEWLDKQYNLIRQAISAFYKLLSEFSEYTGVTKGYSDKEIREVAQYIEDLVNCIPRHINSKATSKDLYTVGACITKLANYIPTVYLVKGIYTVDPVLQYAKAPDMVSFSCVHIETVVDINENHEEIRNTTKRVGVSMLHISADWLKILSRMYRKQCGDSRLKEG